MTPPTAVVIGWEPASGRRWYRRPFSLMPKSEAELTRRLKTWAEFYRKVDAGEIELGAPPGSGATR